MSGPRLPSGDSGHPRCVCGGSPSAARNFSAKRPGIGPAATPQRSAGGAAGAALASGGLLGKGPRGRGSGSAWPPGVASEASPF